MKKIIYIFLLGILISNVTNNGAEVYIADDVTVSITGNLILNSGNINNFGTISRHQNREFPGRQIGTDLSKIDFSEIAKAMGGKGFRVCRNKEFSLAFREALKAKIPAVIDIKVSDYSINAWD